MTGPQQARGSGMDGNGRSWAPARPAGALCLSAGYVDAYGYFRLGTHVFPANMTGNTVFFGTGLATGIVRSDWDQATINLIAIVLFVAGALVSSWLRQAIGRPWLCIVLSAVLLGPANHVLLSAHYQLFLLAFAMGFQGAAMQRFGAVSHQTVVVTGNLLHLADAVAGRAWTGAGSPKAHKPLGLLPLVSWPLYAAGAAFEMVVGVPQALPLAAPIGLLLLTAADVAWLQDQ
ncbi:YoaK family protein [Rhodopila globiformis]|nr:YoaK family protein [Rhodopila globiformis]